MTAENNPEGIEIRPGTTLSYGPSLDSDLVTVDGNEPIIMWPGQQQGGFQGLFINPPDERINQSTPDLWKPIPIDTNSQTQQ